MIGAVGFVLLGIFDDFCKVFHAMFQFHSALFGRFSGFGFHSNLMLQIGERTNFIIALCSNFQILDSCSLLESGTVLEFFIRGINEPAGRVVFFWNNRFSLTLYFDAFPDTFLCVFLTKRFRTATDKTFFIQRMEGDVFGSTSSKDSPLISYPLAFIKSKKSSYVEADLIQKLMSLLSWVFQVEPF